MCPHPRPAVSSPCTSPSLLQEQSRIRPVCARETRAHGGDHHGKFHSIQMQLKQSTCEAVLALWPAGSSTPGQALPQPLTSGREASPALVWVLILRGASQPRQGLWPRLQGGVTQPPGRLEVLTAAVTTSRRSEMGMRPHRRSPAEAVCLLRRKRQGNFSKQATEVLNEYFIPI